MNKEIMPIILTIIDIIQAIVCISSKDYARFFYWVSAAVLTVSTIYMK